ncbi:MAG: sulfotransferase [Halioglobus sp.]|nr:sulfotransferase [Halioglobus sp.]
MSQGDYGPLDRALHRLALGPRFVRQSSFDMQAAALRGAEIPPAQRPVFIAGLARSGSTILLNALYQTGCFRSLTYRDMPFVLMPGIWSKLASSSRLDRAARERAHNDRLLVEYDSPEALEEVFWATYSGDDYIRADEVVPYKPARSVCERFRQYVGFIMASREDERQTRYLAKNNNNLLRLVGLKYAFPDALILIPFRDPLQQAHSLLRQHQQFNALHGEDRFSMQYMNWLGHYEFGLGHKNYAFSAEPNNFDTGDINYWLQSWLDAYNFALESAPADALFLSYEKLCSQPQAQFSALFPRLHLDADPGAAAGFYAAADNRPCEEGDSALVEACAATHARLLQKHPLA